MDRYSLLLLLFLTGCASMPAREPAHPRAPVRTGRAGFFDRLIRADQAARRIAEKGADPAPKTETPAVVSNSAVQLRWPLKQVQVTSPFGKRGKEFHEGVDLRAKTGTTVYAAESGIVLYADKRIRGYGRMVVVQHPGKVATVYAHNSRVLVRKGQKVKKGQVIAYSGQTGQARGPHVHFEVRYGVAPVDPLLALGVTKKRL